MLIICKGCNRSVEPLETVKKDSKTGKSWKILYCPYERCGFNIDLEQVQVKLWNKHTLQFEDYLP